MKQTLKWTAVLLAGAASLVVGIWLLARSLNDREAVYSGKPLDAWRQQLTNADKVLASQASTTVALVIIPALTNQMFSDTHDSEFRTGLIDSLNGLPGIHIDFIPSEGRRAQAAQDLGTLETNATPAIPALVESLRRKDPCTMAAAAESLVKIRADPKLIVPAMIGCLVDDQGHGQGDIVDALAQLGPAARPAVPELIKLLADRSSKDIIIAVPKALKAIDPDAAAKAGLR